MNASEVQRVDLQQLTLVDAEARLKLLVDRNFVNLS